MQTVSEVQLKETVTTMDRLSQGGFSAIETIATLTLAALKDDNGRWRPIGVDGEPGPHPQTLIDALQMIVDRAASTMDDINCAAEIVGAQYSDA